MAALTDAIIASLLPASAPSPVFPEGVDVAMAGSRLDKLDPLRRRAFEWSAVFQAHSESERLDSRYAGFRFATFGFIPIWTECPQSLESSGGYVFGIAIELGPHYGASAQAVSRIDIQGHSFAIVHNRRQYDFNVAHPTSPSIGSGACWARSKRTMLPGVSPEGILTAEHVISGTSLGGTISTTSGGTWYVADRGDCKIDAALVTQAGAIPSKASPLNVQINPVPGTSVEILGNASAYPVSGSITHTMIFPTYLSERNPMRVFLDVHGIGGDSGALVRETSSHDGVALYMAQTSSPQTAPNGSIVEGVCQYLEQARTALNVDLSL